jgi:hypothetical protein
MDKEQIKRDIKAGMSKDEVTAKIKRGGYEKQSDDELLWVGLIFILAILIISGLAAAGVV